LRHYDDAVAAFSVCVGAMPHLAGCYYNRALAFAAQGRADDAVRDYDRAVQLDPAMSGALLNRGMLHYKAQRYGPALEDLRLALARGGNPAIVYYDMALVHLALRERAAARDCVERALQHEPQREEAVRLRENLRREG